MSRVTVDAARCEGCRACLDSCPADVFRFDEGAALAVAEYASDCFACLLCVEDCPTQAITIDPGLASLGYRSIYDHLAPREETPRDRSTSTLGEEPR